MLFELVIVPVPGSQPTYEELKPIEICVNKDGNLVPSLPMRN